jgi:hypothetical protein
MGSSTPGSHFSDRRRSEGRIDRGNHEKQPAEKLGPLGRIPRRYKARIGNQIIDHHDDGA